jgi:hypothetical protein
MRCKREVLSLLFAALPQALGCLPGVLLTGDAKNSIPASAIFGADSMSAAVLTVEGDTLQLTRGGNVRASFSDKETVLPATSLLGELAVDDGLTIGGTKQWSLWDMDTFDEPGVMMAKNADGTGGAQGDAVWSPNDRSFCGSPHDQFLGGHCRFAATKAFKKYSDLPPHTRIRVSGRVHFLDKWRGDSVEMLTDGQPVWSQSHDWCPGFLQWKCAKYGLDTCGQSTPDRLSVHAEATVQHSSPTLELSFASSLPAGTDACQQSWGVDDISIELM